MIRGNIIIFFIFYKSSVMFFNHEFGTFLLFIIKKFFKYRLKLQKRKFRLKLEILIFYNNKKRLINMTNMSIYKIAFYISWRKNMRNKYKVLNTILIQFLIKNIFHTRNILSYIDSNHEENKIKTSCKVY